MSGGVRWFWIVFFFKQKTAYEMLRGLVGSEMCIRDRVVLVHLLGVRVLPPELNNYIRATPARATDHNGRPGCDFSLSRWRR